MFIDEDSFKDELQKNQIEILGIFSANEWKM